VPFLLLAARHEGQYGNQMHEGRDLAKPNESLQSGRGIQRQIQSFDSGSFLHATQTNASGADTNVLANSVNDGANPPEVGVPAAPAGVVSVADHVAVMRRFAANCTLH
jgi:hypothetical protein